MVQPDDRPAIPARLKRALFEEAGYRCAIPTCRGTSALEMAHIQPWSKVREHTFENMIVLCAVDHTRFDRGEIPTQSVQAYKRNLALLHGRYSDAERRVLEAFAQMPDGELSLNGLPIPGGTRYTVMYLLQDGLVMIRPGRGVPINGVPTFELVCLTDLGIEAVRRLRTARDLDPTVP